MFRLLSKKEIRDTIIATFRAYRRRNEKLYDSFYECDKLFTIIRENNIPMSDEKWAYWDRAFDSQGIGISVASKEAQKVFIDAFAVAPPEAVKILTELYLGNNVFSLEAMIEELYQSGMFFWENAQYATLYTMLRFRYRSNTPGLPATAVDDDIYIDEWADWQLQYGYYRLFNLPWPPRRLQ